MTPQHVRDAACAKASELKARGYSSTEAERVAAQLAGTNTRTVRRWLAAGTDTGTDVGSDADTAPIPDSFEVDAAVLQSIAAHRTLKGAYDDLLASGRVLPGYRQFCRLTQQQIHNGVRAALLGDGAKTFHDRHLYLTSEQVPDRNSVWQMDAQEIPVRVLAPRGRIVKPWQISIIDVATRVIVASLITEKRPNTADVKACFAIAVRGQHLVSTAGITKIGGLPEVLVVDNGGEFISDDFSSLCGRLGVLLSPTGAYAAWEKGNIERWHRTIQEELYSQYTGYTHGPKSHTQTEYWDPRETSPAALTSLELLALASDEWVDQYNTQRSHSSLGGITPAAAWMSNPAVLNKVADELLHDCWYEAPKLRRVGKAGIHQNAELWAAPALDDWIGKDVTVRHLPHPVSTLERIAVYDGDTLICVAGRAERMTIEERRETLLRRREAYLALSGAEKAAAARRQQAHDDAVTAGGHPADRSLALAPVIDITERLLELGEPTDTRPAAGTDDEDPNL